MKLQRVAIALVCLIPAAFAQAPKPGSVGFRGKSYDPAQLPADAGRAAKSCVNTWAPWAKSHGYRLDLDPSRRVLLISAKSNVDASLGFVVKTIALFDTLFPSAVALPPEEAGAVASASKPGSAAPDDVIPEDPESPPPGAPKTLPPEREETLSTEKKSASFRPDSETAVILVCKNSADYGAALDQLASSYPYLSDWKAGALAQIGFALEAPLCGAYNEGSPGQEEWNPDNELVHRTMALLILRRFNSQPYWLHTGLCWYAEMAVMKSIYCMPYRDGFVSVGEHGGWILELNSIYAKREKDPLRMPELTLKRGKWDDKISKTALGMVDYLSKANPRALAGLLEELRRFADQNGRQTNADGTWTRIRDYEVPEEQQKLLLERYYGAKLLSDVIGVWTGAAIEPGK